MKRSPTTEPAFVLELHPVGRCTPEEATQRLRWALKALLQRYGLKCVWLEEATVQSAEQP